MSWYILALCCKQLYYDTIYLPSKVDIYAITSISNNPSLRLKHSGVLDGSDCSDGTSYPLTENYTLQITQAMGCVAYLPLFHCTLYTDHQNDMCVTLFAGAAVML